MDFVVGLPPT